MTTDLTTTSALAEPIVPKEYADFAFEYKLGWSAGWANFTPCPIKRKDMMASERRDAWRAGLKAFRKSTGRSARLAPIYVTAS